MLRKTPNTPGEYYHIYNRGNDHQNIFRDDRDRARFLFLILHLQSRKETFPQIGRVISKFVKHRVFDTSQEQIKNIIKSRDVDLVVFALMNNHFHLTVGEKNEGGISAYMQRLLNAYTKYFNTKYERTGHLFQGPYKSVHVEDNKQLVYLSAYIHRNPRELPGWRNREHKYEWSSYQDYVEENRWGDLLSRDIIFDQFDSPKEYKQEVESSGAKEEEFEDLLFNEPK